MKSYHFFNAAALVLFIVVAFVQTGISQTRDNKQSIKDTTVTIQVTGITCGGDLPIISERVKKEKGVADCKAVTKAAATSKFDVTYNPALITYQQIVNAVQDAPSCDFPKEKPYRVKKKNNFSRVVVARHCINVVP